MKSRPIIYQGSMVRAVLDDIKTHTRRIAKLTSNGHVKEVGGNRRWHPADPDAVLACPYGQPGDRLWVRENFQPFLNDDCDGDMSLANWKTGENYHCTYPATDGIHEFMDADDNLRSAVKPSIHMPRWASRIELEITGRRLERLQDISRGDAMAEGCPFPNMADGKDPRAWYMELWEQINGAGSWAANSLVWVIEFKKVKP